MVRQDRRERELLRRLREVQRQRGAPQPAGLHWGLRQLRELDLRATLAALEQPCRFILGGRDTLLPAGAAAALRRLNPALDIQVMAGAAHIPHWSDGATFSQLLGEFLD